jgi:hypothetical protein
VSKVPGPNNRSPKRDLLTVCVETGISPLQYKDLNGETWYRVGEANLPERMEQILAIKPDFTEFITWVSLHLWD